jgi:hypothetical protein
MSFFDERAALRSAPSFSAEGEKIDVRSARGVFRHVHAAPKNRFDFIRGVRAANSARLISIVKRAQFPEPLGIAFS